MLESLNRVKKKKKKIFTEKATIKGLKVKKDSKVKNQNKEKVMDQMRHKIQEDKGRSREE